MKAEKKRYYVNVSYPANWYFDDNINGGFQLDNKIERLNRKANSGSGCGFGRRDINFANLTRKDADNLMIRARKIKKGITAKLYLQEGVYK